MSFYIYDRYTTEGFITFSEKQVTDCFIKQDGDMREYIDWLVSHTGLDTLYNSDGSITLEHTLNI